MEKPTSDKASAGTKTGRPISSTDMPASRTGKYLKYAIGEIVLVMIGILLALQVNNWNQKRIEQNEEKEIIGKLHNDFKENKKTLKNFFIENENEMNALMELMKLVGASKEELAQHNLDSLLFISLAANEIAFADNTLKNIMQGGRLNMLKNEGITDLLYKWNEFSEIIRIRLTKLDNWANNQLLPYLVSKISFKEMDAFSNFEWAGKSKVKPEYYPMFQEVEFENYLDNILWLHKQLSERLQETGVLIDEIINATKT